MVKVREKKQRLAVEKVETTVSLPGPLRPRSGRFVCG